MFRSPTPGPSCSAQRSGAWTRLSESQIVFRDNCGFCQLWGSQEISVVLLVVRNTLAHAQTDRHTDTQTDTHTQIYIYIYIYVYIYIYIYVYAQAQAQAQAQAHAHTHTHTDTCVTHSHIHHPSPRHKYNSYRCIYIYK